MRKVTFFGQTDVGKVRRNNEDNYLVCKIWDDDHVLAAVIDGVGGYEGGEVAAEIARESLLKYVTANSGGDVLDVIKQAVIYANNRIFEQRRMLPEMSSMSCVMTASIIELETMRVNLAHVGDTRLYQYSLGQIDKLSHDHSLVGYREEIGDLTEEEAMAHPQRNIISRDIGSVKLDSNDTTYVEVASYPLENPSQILLCSDGLCDMITSRQMASILSMDLSSEQKVASLIEAALDAGGRDNVTVVLVEVESDELNVEDPVCDEEVMAPGARRFNVKYLLPALLLLISALVLWFVLKNDGDAVEKTSADTTIVAPADTLSSSSDSLDQQLLLPAADEGNPYIHDDVNYENN